jgi:hypothetical protein
MPRQLYRVMVTFQTRALKIACEEVRTLSAKGQIVSMKSIGRQPEREADSGSLWADPVKRRWQK